MMKMKWIALTAFLAFAGTAFAQDTTGVDTTGTDTTEVDTSVVDTTAVDTTTDSTTTLRYGTRTAPDALEMRATAAGMRFAVKEADRPVRFRILDATGRQLWSGRAVTKDGIASLAWSGATSSGRTLNAGVYIVQATVRENGHEAALMQRQFLFRP